MMTKSGMLSLAMVVLGLHSAAALSGDVLKMLEDGRGAYGVNSVHGDHLREHIFPLRGDIKTEVLTDLLDHIYDEEEDRPLVMQAIYTQVCFSGKRDSQIVRTEALTQIAEAMDNVEEDKVNELLEIDPEAPHTDRTGGRAFSENALVRYKGLIKWARTILELKDAEMSAFIEKWYETQSRNGEKKLEAKTLKAYAQRYGREINYSQARKELADYNRESSRRRLSCRLAGEASQKAL